MAYLFKEKFNLSELVALPERSSKVVLLFEPEEYLSRLYHRYLTDHDFQVASFRQVDALPVAIQAHKPDLLVLSTSIVEHLAVLLALVKKLRGSEKSLPIVTIGHGLTSQDLSRLMSVGISSHLERKLTRPKDLVHIVKAILINNDKN